MFDSALPLLLQHRYSSILYLVSGLLHALPPGRAQDVFRVLDHCGIFLLIAICAGFENDPKQGITYNGVQWMM